MSNQDGKLFFVHMVQAQGPGLFTANAVEGTENSWAKLEQAVLVHP